MACALMRDCPALVASLACFLRCPLVRHALCVRSCPALAGDLASLVRGHRGESAILFSHRFSSPNQVHLQPALPFEMAGVMGRESRVVHPRCSRTAGDPVAEKESASSCDSCSIGLTDALPLGGTPTPRGLIWPPSVRTTPRTGVWFLSIRARSVMGSRSWPVTPAHRYPSSVDGTGI